MKRYYIVLFPDGPGGVAYAPLGTSFFLLPFRQRIDLAQWCPFSFVLRDGPPEDFQSTNINCNLCSRRMRQIIDKHASAHDCIQWLPVNVVVAKTSEVIKYDILHLCADFDVLHKEATVRTPDGGVIKPCIDLSRVHDHEVFAYTGSFGTLLMGDCVKDAIERAECTGIMFHEIPAK